MLQSGQAYPYPYDHHDRSKKNKKKQGEKKGRERKIHKPTSESATLVQKYHSRAAMEEARRTTAESCPECCRRVTADTSAKGKELTGAPSRAACPPHADAPPRAADVGPECGTGCVMGLVVGGWERRRGGRRECGLRIKLIVILCHLSIKE